MKRSGIGTDSPIRVTGAPDIAAAVESAERHLSSGPNRSGVPAGPLICEELLLHLLSMGCRDIRVSQKGSVRRYIEICAGGERADSFSAQPETEGERIGAQINSCLLEQYADMYTFRYRNGVNRYRVYAGKREDTDLTGARLRMKRLLKLQILMQNQGKY